MEDILSVIVGATMRIVMAMISLFAQIVAFNADGIEKELKEWRNRSRNREDNTEESLGNIQKRQP